MVSSRRVSLLRANEMMLTCRWSPVKSNLSSAGGSSAASKNDWSSSKSKSRMEGSQSRGDVKKTWGMEGSSHSASV